MDVIPFLWLCMGIITLCTIGIFILCEIHDLKQMEKKRLEILKKRGMRR